MSVHAHAPKRRRAEKPRTYTPRQVHTQPPKRECSASQNKSSRDPLSPTANPIAYNHNPFPSLPPSLFCGTRSCMHKSKKYIIASTRRPAGSLGRRMWEGAYKSTGRGSRKRKVGAARQRERLKDTEEKRDTESETKGFGLEEYRESNIRDDSCLRSARRPARRHPARQCRRRRRSRRRPRGAP